MINRLRKKLWTFTYCAGLLLALTCPSRLLAQPGFFNFNYPGPDTLAVGVDCNLALQGNIPNPTVTSTIGATIITSIFDEPSSGFPFNQLFGAGETAHVFWFVEDNMGHSHSFEFFIFFVDSSPPDFDLTGVNDTLFFNSIVQVPPPPNIPIADNCSDFMSTYVETAHPDTCEAGTFTRTWTATDSAGNTSIFTQTVIILADVSPPTITFPPQNGSAPCTLLATAYPAWLAAQMAAFTAQDPSGIKSLTNNGPASFPPGCTVPLTVVFKATDNCNLMISTTAVFTTSDTQGPVVVVAPKDTIAYCSLGNNHLTKLNEWIKTRAYSQLYDSCSPPLSYSMKINGNVVDSVGVLSAFWASFDSACGPKIVGSQMIDKVSAIVRVDFFGTDACGNQTFAGKATFAAVDTLPPVLIGNNITEECGGGNDQAALQSWINAKGNAIMVDDCSIPFWLNFSYFSSDGQSGFGAFNTGPYPMVSANVCNWFVDITFFASDECGNASSITRRFQIIDTQPPVITNLEPNITVYCPNPLPTVPAATITDNCDLSTTISFTRFYKDSICDGSYTVLTTWQATDDCGNSTTVTQNIFVQDTTRPVFTLVPPGRIIRCDTFVLPPVPLQGININANDLCSPVVSITTNTISFQNPNPALCGHYSYDISRIFTATDECGNTSTATQLITVIDNQPPVPGGVLDTNALCSAMIPFPAPLPFAVDPCSGPTAAPDFVNTDTIPGACAGEYTLRLNWIASDVCGNQSPFEQLVHVIDSVAPLLSNIPPNITVECNAIPTPPNSAAFNGTDNCAATVVVALLESEIRNPDTLSCEHWTDYIIQREWTATDDCGNARTYTQLIQIEDTSPPTLIPPSAITLPNDTDDCGATIAIPAPLSVSDICTNANFSVVLRDTIPITGPSGGILPVDTIVYQFVTPNLPPAQPAITSVSLSVFIDLADIDGTQEYFKIFGENGVFLGNSAQAMSNCGSSTKVLSIPANQFNQWASDGILTITLAPNGTGAAAINATCPSSRTRLQLGYTYSKPHVPTSISYSLDGAPFASFPPPGTAFLAVGSHNVVYKATDCAGNSSSASVQIVVNDVQPPSIASIGTLTTYISPGGMCKDTVALPFPAITENCLMSGHLKKSSIFSLLSFITDPDAPDLVPEDVNMGISALIPNAVGNGILSIKFKGDNSNPREFFNVFNGVTPLLTTNLGTLAGECQDTVLTSIAVTPAQINAWSATGNALFRAEANTDVGPTFDNDFINPCGMVLPDKTDGISKIQATLEYNYAIVDFMITNNATGSPVASGAIQGTNTTVILSPGNYTVKYTTTDNAGLVGMTTFPLIVRDTVKPVAKCKPSLIIQVNPSGVNNYILQPSEINNGSTDNCPGNLTYSLSQSTFTCNQAGSNFIVVMTATDASGNSSACSTVVLVQNAPPMPFAPSTCEGDTLFLFANPPMPGVFSYSWAGPQSYSSNVKDPIRLNAQPSFQGQYTITITGATNCTASASVQVDFANLQVPSLNPNGVHFCQGQNIVLSTGTVMGSGVSYQWYSDSMGTPTLLATTALNLYTIVNPAPGQYNFYVKVKVGDCLTPNSIIATVNVYARPLAIVDDDFISICANDPLAFSTSISGTGLTYDWSGPNGWSSTLQNPLVTSAAMQSDSGIYTLKTWQNQCESIPIDTVIVKVKYTPPIPNIIGKTALCVGDTILLRASVGGTIMPDYYEWMDPAMNIISTGSSNTLIILNASTAHCGNWRVRAAYKNCFSPWSDNFNICPQVIPVVTAMSNSPICQDSTLRLMATTNSPYPMMWKWTKPDNTMSFLQNPIFTPGLLGTYQVIGTTVPNGCADTAFVTVEGSMAPVIDTIVSNAPICADEATVVCLTPTFSSINNPFTYSWKKNGAVVSNSLNYCFPGTPDNNASYTFVVKDSFGCPSAPWTISVNVQAVVKTPELVITPNPVCAGDTVYLSVTKPGDYNGSSLFHWVRPSGVDTITSGPQLVLPGIKVNQSGNYKVFVTQGGCQSAFSNTINLVVNPIPATPIATSNQPVCIMETLSFNANSIPGATYFWTGPAGFISSLQNPERPNALLGYQGDYYLHVVVNGCRSGTDTEYVDIMVRPKDPLITPANPNPVCLEQLPILDFITISPATQTLGATYTWIDPAGNDTIVSSLNPTLNFSNLPPAYLTPGLHQFQVSAWKADNPNGDGCSSAFSNIVQVRFDTIPANVAQTDPDHPACASMCIPLKAVHPSGSITGKWAQIGGPFISGGIVNKDSSTACFPGFAGSPINTYTFTWSLTSGGCKNFSVDTLVIYVAPPDTSKAGPDQYICDGSNVSLNASQGKYSAGTWSQMGQIGVTIADPSEPMTPISGLNKGNRYIFVWTLEDIGCGAKRDTVVVSYYSGKPIITGKPFECTGEGCTQLQATGIQPWETGVWTSETGNLVFEPENKTSTTACGLIPGPNIVYWTINGDSCGINSRDTFIVNYEIFPEANKDTVYVEFGEAATFQVLTNDILPTDPPAVTVIAQPMNGVITPNPSNGSYIYRPNSGFTGEDVMVYKICNRNCDEACSNATVTFIVGDAGSCEIPTIITPNNDGLNDAFIIPAECYFFGEGEAVIEVTIFNQWGDFVYHNPNFHLNLDAWDGKYNGSDLPAGTYYYVVKFNNGEKPRAGFLLIQR